MMWNAGWLKQSFCLAAVSALFLTACAPGPAETEPTDTAPATPVAHDVLTGSFDPSVGFGLDPASIERLPALVHADETAMVEIDGTAQAFDAVDWSTVAAGRALPLVAVSSAGAIRPLADLAVTAARDTRCTAPGNDRAIDVPASVAASLPAHAPRAELATATCTTNNHYWYCTDCQCRSGIYVLGQSRRYICIYGSLYPENVYACNCPFTPHACGSSA